MIHCAITLIMSTSMVIYIVGERRKKREGSAKEGGES
jgi:hypothetical protein